MAETPSAPPAEAAPGSKKGAWLKAAIGTLAGLFSGAVMMYLSPLLDKVLKPAKPVANFAVEHEGTTVTFHNRSMHGQSGWWDFGDGSPLEPVVPGQEVIAHTYASPGDYTAKLSVRNLIGEPDERTVTLNLDGTRGEPPAILALDATPVSPGSYAPATFKVVSKVKNAQVCVWELGDDQPLEILTDPAGTAERMVTFSRPGGYVIKLAAVNGGQAVEKSEIVNVMEAPPGMVTATLSVTDQATKVETLSVPYVFAEQFPPNLKEDAYRFTRQAPARQGYEITDVRLQVAKGQTGKGLQGQAELPLDSKDVNAAGARDLRLKLAPDKHAVTLTGELSRASGLVKGKAPPPGLTVPVVLTQERRTSANRPAVPVTGTLAAPGSALLMLPPLPPDWVDARRQARLQLEYDGKVIWQESQLPRNAPVTLNKRRYLLTAVPVGDHVRVDLVEEKPGRSPAAN
jgi:PKD repeat protein